MATTGTRVPRYYLRVRIQRSEFNLEILIHRAQSILTKQSLSPTGYSSGFVQNHLAHARWNACRNHSTSSWEEEERRNKRKQNAVLEAVCNVRCSRLVDPLNLQVSRPTRERPSESARLLGPPKIRYYNPHLIAHLFSGFSVTSPGNGNPLGVSI